MMMMMMMMMTTTTTTTMMMMIEPFSVLPSTLFSPQSWSMSAS
jgi:hypothetical protein